MQELMRDRSLTTQSSRQANAWGVLDQFEEVQHANNGQSVAVREEYSLLNPAQRTLLRALCLFSEPVSVQGILAVMRGESALMHSAQAVQAGGSRRGSNRAPTENAQAGGSRRGSNRAPTVNVQEEAYLVEGELARLTGLSLVQRTENESGKFRYYLHPALRLYVQEHYLDDDIRQGDREYTIALGVAALPAPQPSLNTLHQGEETRQIALAAGHLRVAAYYTNLAQQRCPPHEKRSGPQDVGPLLAALQHLCLGWHWQQAYDLLVAERLDESLLQWDGEYTLIRLYIAMVPPQGMLNRRDEGRVYSHLGLLYGRLGEAIQSRAYYEQALALQCKVGDRHGEAVTLTNLGELLRSLGAREQARAHFEQALLLSGDQGNEHVQSVVLHNLGLLSQQEKDYSQALRYYVKALKLARALHEAYNEGMILTNLGMLFCEQGRVAESVELLLYALHLRQSMQDPTVRSLEVFLAALEQQMGVEATIATI